ncbi:DUF1674 domain-containing protein [Thermomonas alba]|uniref:DUF1674 domain-containing protein n=1 Tax=Thermomonas alba TaxID=2888525 RepID=UPI003F6FC417
MIGQSPAPPASTPVAPEPATEAVAAAPKHPAERPDRIEIGGRGGLDPTRYGDWEKNGRCIDF